MALAHPSGLFCSTITASTPSVRTSSMHSARPPMIGLRLASAGNILAGESPTKSFFLLGMRMIPKYCQYFGIILIPKRKKDLVGDSPAKMFPALASRRPIIGGRAECIEEVLTDGVDAVIVEQNNPEG